MVNVGAQISDMEILLKFATNLPKAEAPIRSRERKASTRILTSLFNYNNKGNTPADDRLVDILNQTTQH